VRRGGGREGGRELWEVRNRARQGKKGAKGSEGEWREGAKRSKEQEK